MPDTFPHRPINWCYYCGKPMWEWDHPYLVQTYIGSLLACSVCMDRNPGGSFATWGDTMLVWRDRHRLEQAERRKRR